MNTKFGVGTSHHTLGSADIVGAEESLPYL